MLKLFGILFIVHFDIKYGVSGESRTNFDVQKIAKCATDGRVRYSMNITKINHRDYMDFYLNTPIPWDENIGMNWSIEYSLDGKTFLLLFVIREKDLCKAMNKYLGEFWYDMERAAQITPGLCPIRAGRYQLHHYLLNFREVSLQTFPFGILRLTFQGIDKITNTIIICMEMEVNNVQD